MLRGRYLAKPAVLFEKSSKTFRAAVADYPAIAYQKFFGSFFQTRTLT
jgi:hypothetical protein